MRTFILALIILFQHGAHAERLRVAFGSCVSQPEAPIWKAIAQTQPDMFFLLGDSVYLDETILGNSRAMENYYDRLFSTNDFLALTGKTSLFATWDDHDYGPGNGDSSFQHRELSEQLFRKYFQIPERPQQFSRGVMYTFVKRQVRFIVTDNRSYRINPDQPNATLFGQRQLQWIAALLDRDDVNVTVVVSGGQLLSEPDGHDRFETLGQYPQERHQLFKALRNSPSQVVIISGDRHFGDLLQMSAGEGRAVLEVGASPLSAQMANPEAVFPARYRVATFTREPNFGLLALESSSGNITASIRTARQEVLRTWTTEDK